jgi:hypothetical protein
VSFVTVLLDKRYRQAPSQFLSLLLETDQKGIGIMNWPIYPQSVIHITTKDFKAAKLSRLLYHFNSNLRKG